MVEPIDWKELNKYWKQCFEDKEYMDMVKSYLRGEKDWNESLRKALR